MYCDICGEYLGRRAPSMVAFTDVDSFVIESESRCEDCRLMVFRLTNTVALHTDMDFIQSRAWVVARLHEMLGVR